MTLAAFCDIIILIAAVLGAITGIYNFFSKSGKGIKRKVDKVKEEQEKEFNQKVDDRIIMKVQPMIEQSTQTIATSFEQLLDEYLPKRLVDHDLETRTKYLSDRQRYLCEIKDEVIGAMQDKISTLETHEDQMKVFTEVLKELLRERIMEIYRRNKHLRQLEEHERFELKQAYASYKSINGNSYIDGYYATMNEWDTVPDNIE